MAQLRVEATEGATLVIDGEDAGEVPWRGELVEGSHRLRLSGEGLLTWASRIALDAEERTEINVDLTTGRRPAWLPWVEWGLMGIGGALIVGGAASAGAGWSRYQDSEQMFDEISLGRFSSRAEQDLMWDRYNEMYDEYMGAWQAGWALIGVGLAAALASATLLVLEHATNVFGGRPEAEIDLIPIDEQESADVESAEAAPDEDESEDEDVSEEED